MQESNKKYLLEHLHDKKLYNAIIDLLDSKLEEKISVVGACEKDPITKMYKLLSVDAAVDCIKDIKGTFTEINEESFK